MLAENQFAARNIERKDYYDLFNLYINKCGYLKYEKIS